MDETVLTERCACGVKIRYLPKHVGRTVKCRSCGGGVTLAGPDDPPNWDDVVPDEDDGDDAGAYGVTTPAVKMPGMSVEAQARLAADKPAPTITPPARLLGRESQIKERRKRGFWKDAGRTFAFWKKPESAIALVVVTALLLIRSVAGHIPILGLILWIGITGMVWGFYLEVIRYTAGGDDDLPDPSAWENFWESGVMPIVRLMAVTGACAIPAVAVALAGLGETPAAAAAGFGLFLWPVGMLAASIGGAGAAVRLDLLVRTIASAFLPYLGVWFMLLVAGVATSVSLLEGMGVLPGFLERAMAMGFGATVVTVFTGAYTSIITMKLIGLYYRHYSDRFPWDAG